MARSLRAEKVGGKWVVKVTETITVFHKDDVLKEIKQRGLRRFDPPELRDTPVTLILAN